MLAFYSTRKHTLFCEFELLAGTFQMLRKDEEEGGGGNIRKFGKVVFLWWKLGRAGNETEKLEGN